MTDDFDALFSFGGVAPAVSSPRRPCILLVTHDASRTGAPLTLLHLADALQKLNRFELRIVAQNGGPLVDDFARVAPLCNGADHCARLGIGNADIAAIIASKFATLQPRGLAICNTVAAPDYNEAFMRAGVDLLTLIHELPAFFAASTMDLIVRSSKHIGVYSEWNRARFRGPYKIPDDKLVITPPILPHLAATTTTSEERRAARHAIGIDENALMVLGVGYVHLIKGADLFIQIAARCRRMLSPASGRQLVFCWIGDDCDSMTPLVLAHDIAALGLLGVVLFSGLQSDPWPWYRAADVFACTSRWEALSLGVLEAMSSGLPVVTFSETGASRFVADGAGTVVPSLDIEAFSEAIVGYLNDRVLRTKTGETGHRRVRLEFGEGKLPKGLISIVDALP
jgi:glycosyltransferase involved in cell wall biosynthesis